jgi:hypothetical protein
MKVSNISMKRKQSIKQIKTENKINTEDKINNKKIRKTKKNKGTLPESLKGGDTYSNEDYNAGEGMLTTVWGPSMWHFLHTMSFNYPVHPTEQDKKHYMDFVLNLQNVLPCKYCRINLKNNFKTFPLTTEQMTNRESFSRYIYELHEIINKMLKKTSNLSYDEVRERYEHFRARCTLEKTTVFKFKNESEKGCTEPLYGKKSKCILKIVPQEDKSATFQMDKKCIKKRVKNTTLKNKKQ